MGKKKIVGSIIVVCCVVVCCVFLAQTDLFRKAGSDQEQETESHTGKGQNLSYGSDTEADILSRHALPDFERMEKNDQDQYVNSLEVLKKAENLGIEKKELLYPKTKMSDIEKSVSAFRDRYDAESKKVIFRGNTSDKLQQAIENNPDSIIDIAVDQIQLYDTIILRDNIVINGNGVKLVADGLQYGFVGENISNVCISDVCIEGGLDYGVYFVDCNNISVSSCKINGLSQKPICIVGTTKGISVCDNEMHNNQAGGIYIAGAVSDGIVDSNDIQNNEGTSNWMAGIVLTSTLPDDKRNIWETFDEAHHFPIRENWHTQLDCPHEIIVSNNSVLNNNSSGIYSDGAYMCYILNNRVYRNDKEGICLDYATIGCYLEGNIFEENGRRMRQTDEDLRMDFVLSAGRMDDGSAKAKLPGVSLDDTTYNILENNIVINNYGGGIKMVRTTVRSLIMGNIIRDNNMGQNDAFHFFGIELGVASGDVDSGNAETVFLSDYENIICRNSITGNHYAGVYIGEDCYMNDIFDNIIMDAKMFAVEAVSKKLNTIENNISNCGIRNEYQE